MNEVVISGVVSQVQERGKVLEITLVGKPHQGAFFRVRLKAFGKVKEALQGTLKEGEAVGALGSLIAREREGKPSEFEVAVRKTVKLEDGAVKENQRGPYLEGAVNQVLLGGYLGKDPDLRYIPIPASEGEEPGAIALLHARVAARAGDRTVWVTVKAWGETAEAAADALKKGSFVVLRGRYRLESYEKDGEKVFRPVVIAEEFLLQGQNGKAEVEEDEDDLPF